MSLHAIHMEDLKAYIVVYKNYQNPSYNLLTIYNSYYNDYLGDNETWPAWLNCINKKEGKGLSDKLK